MNDDDFHSDFYDETPPAPERFGLAPLLSIGFTLVGDVLSSLTEAFYDIANGIESDAAWRFNRQAELDLQSEQDTKLLEWLESKDPDA